LVLCALRRSGMNRQPEEWIWEASADRPGANHHGGN
jgi:hypothetical protein